MTNQRNNKTIANDELKKSTPAEIAKALKHASEPIDFDYQDHDSFEQPTRNSERGYAPIDSKKPKIENDAATKSKQED